MSDDGTTGLEMKTSFDEYRFFYGAQELGTYQQMRETYLKDNGAMNFHGLKVLLR